MAPTPRLIFSLFESMALEGRRIDWGARGIPLWRRAPAAPRPPPSTSRLCADPAALVHAQHASRAASRRPRGCSFRRGGPRPAVVGTQAVHGHLCREHPQARQVREGRRHGRLYRPRGSTLHWQASTPFAAIAPTESSGPEERRSKRNDLTSSLVNQPYRTRRARPRGHSRPPATSVSGTSSTSS